MHKYTPEQAASCMFNIMPCPGRTAKGNMYKCCPNDDPGSFHIAFGMTDVPGKYATREEAVEEAKRLATWVAIAIRYDREDLFGKHTKEPDPELTPEALPRRQ